MHLPFGMLNNPHTAPFLFSFSSLLILWFIPIQWEGLSSFLISTPFIIFFASWLALHSKKDIARDIAAFFFLFPVIGFIAWKRELLNLNLEYLQKDITILELVWLSRQILIDSNMFILSIAFPFLFIAKQMRQFFWAIIASSSVALGCTHLSYIYLMHDDTYVSSFFILGTELSRILVIIVAIQVFQQVASRNIKLFVLLFSLVSMWISTPSLTIFFYKISFSKAHPDAPEAEEGLGYTQKSIDPFSPTFKTDLDNQDIHLRSGNGWWCDYRIRDSQIPRINIALSLSKSIYLSAVKDQFQEMLSRGITQFGLLGQIKDPKTLPPLNRHTQNPTISWRLDPPPPSARRGYIENDELVWEHRLPSQDCQIWTPWQTNVETLFHVGEKAQKECNNLFLILSEPSETWVPPALCLQTAQN